jgi:NADP-dependent 3-hydroxy acid dehydrogenase YdfG
MLAGNGATMMASPVALITGCGSGIARHLTTVLSRQGYRILATDVRVDTLEASARDLRWNPERVQLKKLDVREADDWRAAIAAVVDTWGRLDVCMNIAGFAIQGFVHEFPLEHIDLHLDINTKGAILGTRFAAEQMLKQGSGHIINMSSLAGLAPVPGTSLYSASKFALRGFSLAAYHELKPHGIDVSIVEPDLVDTAKLQTQLIYGDAAAAVGFSAPKILRLEDVERVFLKRVLKERALEVAIPRSRGWLSKFAGNFPRLSARLLTVVAKTGMSNLAREKARRKGYEQVVTPDKWLYQREVEKKRTASDRRTT